SEWLVVPLAERHAAEARLDAVAEFHADHRVRSDLRGLLDGVLDLQRLTARASTGRATPRDLAAVARTLRLLPALKARVTGRTAPLLADLERRLELCPDLREALDAALVDEPPIGPREGGVLRDGYHAELDALRTVA